MRHIFLITISLLLSLFTATNVMADDVFSPYYYVGGSVGLSDSKWDYDGFDSSGFGFGAYGGYQFNQYLAVEGQFTHFAKATNGNNSVKTNALAAFLKGSIRVGTSKFKLFSKVGLASVFNSGYASNKHFGLAFAYGVDFPLTKSLTAEAAYTLYIGKYAGNATGSVPNANYYSVGLAYVFSKNVFG